MTAIIDKAKWPWLTQQRLERIEHEISQQPDFVQQAYRIMVDRGECPSAAQMFAMQEVPRTKNSDRTFNDSYRRSMNSMDDHNRRQYLEMARRAGINTNGKFYVGGLGRPSDPAAWVSTVDDVKEVCKRKNLTATNHVEHQGTPMPPPKRIRLAEDLVQECVTERLAADPALKTRVAKNPKAMQALREEVIETHAPPK